MVGDCPRYLGDKHVRSCFVAEKHVTFTDKEVNLSSTLEIWED
jgi:hypothetical protein